MGKEDVPIDIVSEILCLLPVKSLRRFQMVSKSWCSLMHHPCFISSHLRQSTKANSGSVLLCLAGETDICISGMNSPGNFSSFDFPMLRNELLYNRIQIRGSCNGLTCLTVFDRFLIISNLSTKDYHIKPIPSSSKPHKSIPFYGFGFDWVTDDYKVLMIVPYNTFQCKEDDYYAESSVYSLSCNAWTPSRRCDLVGQGRKFPCLAETVSPVEANNGVFSSGALHWVADKSGSECYPSFILAFDLTTEDFYEMPLPPHSSGQQGREQERERRINLNNRLAVLEGCLLMSSRVCHVNSIYDIWIMKDYSIHGCWTKLFRIVSDVMMFTPFTPLVYSRCEHKVLLLAELYCMFCWCDCDLEKQQLKCIPISPPKQYRQYPIMHPAAICLGTLVSISAYKAFWKEDASSRRGRERKTTDDIDMQTQLDPLGAEFDKALSCFFIFLDKFNSFQSKC